jgi:hypothetical protein
MIASLGNDWELRVWELSFVRTRFLACLQ